ncbi:A/G-specific adenine glycosylase [Nocardioidaceae bacterium]|nr:A/G-specific adenine glycosylase [Nocardioidaceae bacterium]
MHEPILAWYAQHARELPWRGQDASAWSVLVSELMLQQTPVSRVLPVHTAWLARWPAPADLAAEPAGEAVRAWGRLGYPRRALRLHAAAAALVERHGGEVPASYEELIALPGVGDYTAAAVASFAFGRRHVVLDTNVRRVLARAVGGEALPRPSVNRAERDRATAYLPAAALGDQVSATWAVATMELGALVCTAREPRCAVCPVRELCVWRAAGKPAYTGPARRTQDYDGTDRQCRGRLLAVLREASGPVPASRLETVWPSTGQRERCLDTLVADGLVVRVGEAYALP